VLRKQTLKKGLAERKSTMLIHIISIFPWQSIAMQCRRDREGLSKWKLAEVGL